MGISARRILWVRFCSPKVQKVFLLKFLAHADPEPCAGYTISFFFSSRRRHTRSLRDWSSDVCSSDLAALVAVLIGFPAIRLTGFFLAIATLAFGFVIVEGLTAADGLTGGGAGLSVDIWRLPGITGSASTYFVTAAVAVITFLLARRSLYGRFGRTLQTVRHLGPLVGSLGVSALRYRLVAFGISGGIAAIAGGLYAQLQTFIFPAMFDFNLLVPFLVMVFVGGAGSLLGPILGAAFAVVLVEVFQDLGDFQAIAYGLALMLAITVLRGGLVSLGAEVRDSRLVGRLTGRRAEKGAVQRAQ